MKRVVFAVALAALCCAIAKAQTFKVGEAKRLAGAAAFTRAPARNDGSVHRLPPYFGHAMIDVNTWQPVPGGANRATPLYDNTVNDGDWYCDQTLSNVTGDDLRMIAPALTVEEITLSIVNPGDSGGALRTSDFRLDVRDYMDPTIVLHTMTGHIDWEAVFGLGGLPAGHWAAVTFTGLTCGPAAVGVTVGWSMTNITGGMAKGGQALFDPVTLGSSKDWFWEDAAGVIKYRKFNGLPHANVYYAIAGTPAVVANTVYSDIDNFTGSGFDDALGPDGPTIFDDLLLAKFGTVKEVEFSLYNTSAVTLMKVDVDIRIRQWDPVAFAYTADLYVISGTIDMTGFGGLRQYSWAAVTVPDLDQLSPQVVLTTNDVLFGLKYYNPTPANSTNMGQVTYYPPTIGVSDNTFYLEGSPTYFDAWYWLGGTPYADFYWRINIVSGCKGDMNCDRLIDFQDIDPFVAVLSGGTCCDGTGFNCDVDGNGSIGFEDIDPFVLLLSSGATCP